MGGCFTDADKSCAPLTDMAIAVVFAASLSIISVIILVASRSLWYPCLPTRYPLRAVQVAIFALLVGATLASLAVHGSVTKESNSLYVDLMAGSSMYAFFVFVALIWQSVRVAKAEQRTNDSRAAVSSPSSTTMSSSFPSSLAPFKTIVSDLPPSYEEVTIHKDKEKGDEGSVST